MARANLVQNPSFRLGTTGWSPTNGSTISIGSGGSFYGEEYLLITKAARNDSGVQSDYINITPGLEYAFSVYASVPITVPAQETAGLILKTGWYSPLGVFISESVSEVVTIRDRDGWTRLTGVDTAPLGAVTARLSLTQLAAGKARQVFRADAFLFEQSSFVGGYLDNLVQSLETRLTNSGLSAFPLPPIGGLTLDADITIGDLVLNTIDEYNVVWVCSDIEGWWGQAAPDMIDIPRGVDDGSYDVSGRYDARVFTLKGSFLLPDPSLLGEARDRLVAATNLVRKGAWLRTNESPTRAAFVRLSGRPQIETVNARGRTDFSIGLKASDPIRYEWNDEDPRGENSVQISLGNTYTNFATNPSFETFSGTSVYKTNLSTSPRSHVSGTTAATWSGPGMSNADVLWAPSTVARKFTTTEVGTPYAFVGAIAETIRAGEQVTLSAYVQSDINVDAPYLALAPHIKAGDTYYTRAIFSNDGSASRRSITWSPTADILAGTPLELAVLPSVSSTGVAASVPVGFTYYVADVQIERGTLSDYFDGSSGALSSSDSDISAIWMGTTNASPSSLTYPNVVGATPSNALAISSQVWAGSGMRSMRIKSLTSTGGLAGVDLLSSVPTTLVPGKTYTASITVHRESATTRIGGLVYEGVQNQNSLLRKVSEITKSAGEQIVSNTFTVPLGATASSLRVISGETTSGPDLWVDNFVLVDGATVVPYFDGSTENTPDALYSWTGAVNVSTSVRRPGPVMVGALDNIGTADVTGTFEMVGPAGAGSSIYNSLTGERITITNELRGASGAAAITNKQLTNGVVTLTTAEPHKLIVGDRVIVSGAGSPFDAVNEVLTVTAVSNLFPYSFNYLRQWPDIDPTTSAGQVSLANDDVLSVDTYQQSVEFNGSVLGHRSRVETLVDWIKIAPGQNLISFTDKPTQRAVFGKSLTNNEARLYTSDAHYFTPGELVYVELPVTAVLAKKSLTGNVATLTTATNHGFAVGDVINVSSSEVSGITAKALTSNVVTLTTDKTGAYNIGDLIVVDLAVNQAITRKAIASGVATITTAAPHGYSVGDSVVITLSTNALINSKALAASLATIGTTVDHGFSSGDTITVALPTTTTVVRKYVAGQTVILTTKTPHQFSLGDQVTVALPTTATLTSSRTMAGPTSYLVTLNTTTAHGFVPGDRINVQTGLPAATGVGYDGMHVIETVPSSTSFTFLYYNQSASSSNNTVATGTVTNVTNTSINGTYAISSVPSSTEFSYSV